MNEAKLEKIILSADMKACAEFFDGMAEAERRKLAPLANKYVRESWKTFLDSAGTGRGEGKSPGPRKIGHCAGLAAIATASLSELKKLSWFASPNDNLIYLGVVKSRNAPWLQDWCGWVVDQSFRDWSFVRRCVREGLCEAPETDMYVLGMINAFMPGNEKETLLENILADAEVLENLIWRLFEVEGGGELSLAAYDKYGSEDISWAGALRKLSQKGYLSRDRLLDASLAALSRDFSQFRVGWFSRFHEFLEPTLAERAARTESYLNLLKSPIPPTVSFALKALQALHRKQQLPGAAFVAAVEPVFFAKAKGTVKTALKMVADLAKADPALRAPAATVIVAALEHEAPEVQEGALSLLEKLGDPASGELRALVDERRDLVAASLRPRLAAWVGDGPAPAEAPLETEDLSALIKDAKALPKDLAALAGIDPLLSELVALQGDIAPTCFDGTDIPRLSADEKIPPIDSFDDLLAEFLQALEAPEEVERVERVLDGLARLSAQRPADFAKRMAPFAKRVKHLKKRSDHGDYRGTSEEGNPLGVLLTAAEAWLGEGLPTLKVDSAGQVLREYAVIRRHRKGDSYKDVEETERCFLDFLGVGAAFFLRTRELAERLAQGVSLSLLSTPTHRGGWIAPTTLVARTEAWEASGSPMGLADQVLALLRLAPDGRAGALAAAADLAGEWGAALRHALGSGTENPSETAALWVAAARARAPFDDDSKVAKRFPNLGPDAGSAAKLDYVVTVRKDQYQTITYTHHIFTLLCEPQPHNENLARTVKGKNRDLDSIGSADLGATMLCLPTVAMHGNHAHQRSNWTKILWPLQPVPFFAAAAESSHSNVDEKRPAYSPIPPGFFLALDPDVPLTVMGRIMLCHGLNARDAAEAQLATDILIAAFADGRMNGGLLGGDLPPLLYPGLIKPKRLSQRLKDVADAGPLHHQETRCLLETALKGEPGTSPNDIHALFELLHELCLETGEAVTDPATRAYLESFSGSSKAAKLAKKLLALQEGDPKPHRRAAAAEALAQRIERVERWAGRLG